MHPVYPPFRVDYRLTEFAEFRQCVRARARAINAAALTRSQIHPEIKWKLFYSRDNATCAPRNRFGTSLLALSRIFPEKYHRPAESAARYPIRSVDDFLARLSDPSTWIQPSPHTCFPSTLLPCTA